jgi:hypothetical protein
MITRKQALQIARDECERRGWPWNEQAFVQWGIFAFTVWGGGRKGCNLCVRVRKRDGAIVKSFMTPN